MKKQYVLGAAMMLAISSLAIAADNSKVLGIISPGNPPSEGNMIFAANGDQDNQEGTGSEQTEEHYTIPESSAHGFLFYVITNLAPEERPNSVATGSYVFIPEGAILTLYRNKTRQDPQYGEVVNISVEDNVNSQIPSDFEISAQDLRVSGAQLVPEDVLTQLENAGQTEQEAKVADLAAQQADEQGYATPEASYGRRAYAYSGSGGRRHAGMTYCLANVEDRAKQMGVCRTRIMASPQGWARTSLPGFVSKCGMTRYNGSNYQSLPIGSVCVSHGTFHHYCGGSPCGDAKIKVGAHSWYGVGYSSSAQIGPMIGCATPSGSRVAATSDSSDKSEKSSAKSSKRKTKTAKRSRHYRYTYERNYPTYGYGY